MFYFFNHATDCRIILFDNSLIEPAQTQSGNSRLLVLWTPDGTAFPCNTQLFFNSSLFLGMFFPLADDLLHGFSAEFRDILGTLHVFNPSIVAFTMLMGLRTQRLGEDIPNTGQFQDCLTGPP